MKNIQQTKNANKRVDEYVKNYFDRLVRDAEESPSERDFLSFIDDWQPEAPALKRAV